MQRFVKIIELQNNPESISGYIKVHNEIPEEIVEGIKSVGISTMDLYIFDNKVVMIMECPDNIDINEAMKKLAKLPGQEEWERLVSTYQVCNPEDTSAEKWKEMEKIFSLPK